MKLRASSTAVALLLVLTGCSSESTDDTPAPPPVVPSPPDAKMTSPTDARLLKKANACSLVTTADLEHATGTRFAVLGEDQAHPATNESSCHYGLEKQAPPIPLLRVVTILGDRDGRAWAERVKIARTVGAFKPVQGIGSSAYKGNMVWLAVNKERLIVSFEKIDRGYQISDQAFQELARTALKRFAK